MFPGLPGDSRGVPVDAPRRPCYKGALCQRARLIVGGLSLDGCEK